MVKDFPAYLNKPQQQLPAVYRVFKLPEKHGLSRFSTRSSMLACWVFLSAQAIQASRQAVRHRYSVGVALSWLLAPTHVFSYSAALVEDRSVSACVSCSAPTTRTYLHYNTRKPEARARFMEWSASVRSWI